MEVDLNRYYDTVNNHLSELANESGPVAARLMAKLRQEIDILASDGLEYSKLANLERQYMAIEFQLHKNGKPSDAGLTAPKKQEEHAPEPTTVLRNRKTRLDVTEELHSTLIDDLEKMTARIKENALKFTANLESDAHIVDAAGDALQSASSNMSSVGARLNRYQKSTALGWKFYIFATIFVVAALMFGMILIQLFPKF